MCISGRASESRHPQSKRVIDFCRSQVPVLDAFSVSHVLHNSISCTNPVAATPKSCVMRCPARTLGGRKVYEERIFRKLNRREIYSVTSSPHTRASDRLLHEHWHWCFQIFGRASAMDGKRAGKAGSYVGASIQVGVGLTMDHGVGRVHTTERGGRQ